MSDSVKILVVGDDDEINLLTRLLRQTYATIVVESVTSASACLARLKQKQYRAIIIDPDFVQEEVVRRSFEDGHELPIVVVSDENSPQAGELESSSTGSCYVRRDSNYLSALRTTIAAVLDTSSKKELSGLPGAISAPPPSKAAVSLQSPSPNHSVLQAAINGVSDVFFQVDDRWRVTFANRNFLNLLDNPQAGVVGQSYSKLLCQRETPCDDCPVRLAAASGKRFQKEQKYFGKTYAVSCYPVSSDDETCTTVHCKDLTERKNLENQLLQSEKLASIGLLAAGVAHELRNPLNIIETARYYLDTFHAESNADIKDKLDMIRRSVQRSAKIINNLLEFVRPEQSEQQEIPLKAIIESTIALVGKEFDARNIECHVDGSEKLKVFFSTDDLRQVFLNLFMNSMQAMPEGGRLSVRLIEPDSRWVEVHISDTGVGIPTENLSHIFSPFFTTKRVGEGTGLGLYLSHLLLARSRGKIQVESDNDSGTTFIVSIPQCET